VFGLIDSFGIFFACVLKALGGESESPLTSNDYGLVVVKSLALVGDLSLALITWGAGRAVGIHVGWLSTAVILLNPAFIYDGAVWGQVDSIFSTLLVGAIVTLAHNSWRYAGLLCSLAVLTKPQALVLVPYVLISAALLGGRRAVWKGVLAASATLLSILSPFLITGRIHGVFNSYLNHIGAYPELTINAYNGWWFICELAAETCKTAIPGSIILNAASIFSVIIFILLYIILLIIINYKLKYASTLSLASLRLKARLEILLVGSAIIYSSLFTVSVQMHERYLYPAIALLAPIALWRFRTLIIYLLFSFCSFLNMAIILPFSAIPWITAQLGFSPFFISIIMITGTSLAWTLLAVLIRDDQVAKRRIEQSVLVTLVVTGASGWVALNTIGVNVGVPWEIIGPAMSAGMCVATVVEIVKTMALFKQRPSLHPTHGVKCDNDRADAHFS